MRLQNRIRKPIPLAQSLVPASYSSAVFLLEGNLNNRLASSAVVAESWKAGKLFLTNFLTDAAAPW